MLWFVEHFSNKVGRLDPLSGRIDEFTIPSSGVYSIESAVDAEGNFWFTEFAANKLGELSASAAVPLEVKPIQPASISLQAGGLTQAEFMVTNEMSSSATISLNVTATLSVTGSPAPSEAT